MKCPDEGQLLAYQEKELEFIGAIAIEDHLATCRICQRRLQVLQEDLEFCRTAITPSLKQGLEQPVTGQYRVWEKVKRTHTSKKEVKILMKFKKAAIAAVVILTMVGLLSIPSVRAVADNLLQIFRVNQVSTVTLTAQDVNNLKAALNMGDAEVDLDQFGQMKTIGKQSLQEITSVAEAPFAVKMPPELVPSKIYLRDTPDAELTLNVESVNQLLKQLGSNEQLPRELSGKPFRLILPEMVTAAYQDFKVIQGRSPEIQTSAGVDIEQIRNAVINLPIWSPEVRTQLTAIQDWQHTLIIPDDGSNQAREVKVGDQRGVYMSAGSEAGQLMWQDNGYLMMVEVNKGGESRAIQIAESLR